MSMINGEEKFGMRSPIAHIFDQDDTQVINKDVTSDSPLR